MEAHQEAGKSSSSSRSRRSSKPLVAVPALVWVTILALASAPAEVHAADFFLEATASQGNISTQIRTNARTGVSVRLESGENIDLKFCLRQSTVMQVLGVLYSNDGPSDTVVAVVDEKSFLGNFTSHGRSDWGRLWDEFLLSPALPGHLALPEGEHNLRLKVLSSSDVIELDSVHVRFSDQGLTREIVDCLKCMPPLPAVPQPPGVNAIARQASNSTYCAEEDNVKVPLYLDGISQYNVTATMPSPLPAENHREPNDMGCAHLSPLLFFFTALPPSKYQPFVISNPTASLKGYSVLGTGKQILHVEFQLKGRSEGHVDADMGSVLTISFKETSATDVCVKTSYLGRTGKLRELSCAVVPAGKASHVQLFEDFTWQDRGQGNNTLQLEFQSEDPVHVKELQFTRRAMLGEKVQTVYRSDSMVVETVEVDFWWRRPEMMRLENGETGDVWSPVDFFRIYLAVPGTTSFAQVFVMYQDGNVRLLPLPPPGVDWIPFGSSVIIGYSDPAQVRPSAPVKSVVFYPSTLAMHLKYEDGGSAQLRLTLTRTQTQLLVQDIVTSGKDAWGMPFAMLRSMYIKEGNSDCDSILVDGTTYRPITGPWDALHGKSFFFFRRCESHHLSRSPDIRIDVKETSPVDSPAADGQ